MSNQQGRGLVPFQSQDRTNEDDEPMSSFVQHPSPNSQPNLANLLYAYIRRDIADAFTATLHDSNIQTSNTINNLQGEVFQWAQQMNYKFDLTIGEIFHAFNTELESRLGEVAIKHTAQQQEGLSIVNKSIESQHQKIEEATERHEKQTITLSSYLEQLENHKVQTQKSLDSIQQNLEERTRRIDNRIGNNQSDINNKIAGVQTKLEDSFGKLSSSNKDRDQRLDEIERHMAKQAKEARAENSRQQPHINRPRERFTSGTVDPASDNFSPHGRNLIDDDFQSDRYSINMINDSSESVMRAKSYWFRAISYDDLRDHHARRMKNLAVPVNSRLPEIATSADPNIWDKMAQIQTSLRADMSPYDQWPMRIVHLFTMEFEGVARRIEEENPSWITLVVWIGEKVGSLHHSYSYCLKLHEFSSQVEEVDTPRDVVTKLYRIAQNIPPNMMTPAAMVTTIKAQLHRYIPQVHDRMSVLHSDKEGVPRVWLEELINLPNRGYELGQVVQPKPIDIVGIPRHQSRLDGHSNAQPVGLPPLNQTVNQVENKRLGSCWKCGKEGHWAYQCHSSDEKFGRPRKDHFLHRKHRRVFPNRRENRDRRSRYQKRRTYHIADEGYTDSEDDGDHSSSDEYDPPPDKYTAAFEKTMSDEQQSKPSVDDAVNESQTTSTLHISTHAMQTYPDREGEGPHHLYKAVLKNKSCSLPVFFDSGSGPSWIKQRCVQKFSLHSFPANRPAQV